MDAGGGSEISAAIGAEREEPSLPGIPAEPVEDKFDQLALFDLREPWEEHWVGMPEFVQEDLQAWRQVVVSFASYGDQQAFAHLIGQRMTPNTRSVWFPPAEIGRYANKRFIDGGEA